MAWSQRLSQQQVINTVAWTGVLTAVGLGAALAWQIHQGGSIEEFGLRLGTVAMAEFLIISMSAIGGCVGAADYCQAPVHSRPQAYLQSSMRSEVAQATARPFSPFIYAVLSAVLLFAMALAVLIIW